MQGYWNNPTATAETITPDGWLRTGDIVSADPDGYVRIHDRKKEMIKYKGYQVAPAELESVLMEHPGVRDAAVIPKADDEAGEVPKAFVVAREPGLDLERRAGVRRREGRAVQEDPRHRDRGGDPEEPVGQDPAPPAHRAGAREASAQLSA